MFDVLPEMRCATRLNDGLMQLTNFFIHDQTFSGVLWLLSQEMEFPMGKNEQKRTFLPTVNYFTIKTKLACFIYTEVSFESKARGHF